MIACVIVCSMSSADAMRQATAEPLRAMAALISAKPYPCLPSGLLPRAVPEPHRCALLGTKCALCRVSMRCRMKDTAPKHAVIKQQLLEHLRGNQHDLGLRNRIATLFGAVLPSP